MPSLVVRRVYLGDLIRTCWIELCYPSDIYVAVRGNIEQKTCYMSAVTT